MSLRRPALLAATLLAGCAADPRVEGPEPAEERAPIEEVVPEPVPVAEAPAPEVAAPPEREPVAPERWASLLDEIRSRFPDVPQLSTEELAEWLASDERSPVLLDVREPGEFEVSHLEGALRARDLGTARALLADVPTERPVVLYCSVGYRSSELAAALRSAGRENVFNLEGSIFAWANEDRALERAGERTELVHPYDRDWGRLLRRERWAELPGEEPR